MTTKVKNIAKAAKAAKPAKAAATRKGRIRSSRLSAKNQVTVPIEISRAVGFEVGDRLHFKIEDGRVVIEKDKPKILELVGLCNGLYRTFDLAEERRTAWRE